MQLCRVRARVIQTQRNRAVRSGNFHLAYLRDLFAGRIRGKPQGLFARVLYAQFNHIARAKAFALVEKFWASRCKGIFDF